ncbi:MAG: hypothetical protein ACFN28_04225, partial [Rothia dentocariosa]
SPRARLAQGFPRLRWVQRRMYSLELLWFGSTWMWSDQSKSHEFVALMAPLGMWSDHWLHVKPTRRVL